MKYLSLITAAFLGSLSAHQAMAAPTPFALRCEANAVSIHGGVTSQTIESTFGTNALGLSFTGTNAYDFYSPPISTPITLSANDKTSGLIVMSNAAPTDANDFSAFGWMNFYDYDPVSGTDTFVAKARQPANAARRVVHGKAAQWLLVQAPQHNDYTIPPGHLLHIVVTLVLNSGDPGNYGRLIYNGPLGTSTMAMFPRNSSLPASWTPASLMQMAPNISSLIVLPDGTARLNCTGVPSAYYLIQATTNLGDPAAWTTLSTNLTDRTGTIQWTDTDAANHPFRYYRLATP